MWLILALSLAAADETDRLIADAEALLASGQAERAASLLRSKAEGGAAGDRARAGQLDSLLGRASRASGDLESAAPAFARAFQARGDPAAALSAAECWLEMKNAEAAKEVLRKCGETSDAQARAAADELWGIALFLEMKEDAARPYLERARAGGRPMASHFLGILRFHRGEYKEAIALFDEAIRSDPEDYYSLLYRAWAFLDLNLLDDARRALDATKAVADTPEVENMSGQVDLRAERFETALVHFRAALAGNPGYTEAQFGIATALRRLGRTDEAKQASSALRKLHVAQQENLRIAYELNQKHLADPRNPAFAGDLARHYLKTGDFQEAERFAWQVLAIDPARQSERLVLARSLAATGRYQAAAFHFRKILRASPDQAEARAELEDLVRRHARMRSGS